MNEADQKHRERHRLCRRLDDLMDDGHDCDEAKRILAMTNDLSVRSLAQKISWARVENRRNGGERFGS